VLIEATGLQEEPGSVQLHLPSADSRAVSAHSTMSEINQKQDLKCEHFNNIHFYMSKL